MSTEPYMREMLNRFCADNKVTIHQVWSAAKQMIDAEFAESFKDDDEKQADICATIKATRASKERNHFGNRKDPRVEGVKRARQLFGFGLREALNYVDALIEKGKA